MNHWMIVTSAQNFACTESLGFVIQGVKSRHRKKAEKMQPGDRIVYYITGEATFAGVCEITSRYFEAHERIWSSPGKPDEDYPWRVKIRKLLLPASTRRVRADAIKDQMLYAKKWPAAHWKLAFQGNVHLLPAEDFETIRSALAAAQPAITTF